MAIADGGFLMKDPFLSHWFSGFEAALEQMDQKNQRILLAQCGKACSNSYTRQIYIEEYRAASDILDFLARLKERFPESDYRVTDEGNTIEWIYRHCACDLATKGYLKTPLLCECSRQSLLSNWESALGSQRVSVDMIHSILGGHDHCKFRIRFKSRDE